MLSPVLKLAIAAAGLVLLGGAARARPARSDDEPDELDESEDTAPAPKSSALWQPNINKATVAQSELVTRGGVTWPLPDWPPEVVQRWTSGARTFGAARSSHVHAGVDLGPPRLAGYPMGRAYGSRVVAPLDGVVDLTDGGWDGPAARRIEMTTAAGRLVFGAVQGAAAVAPGQQVKRGQILGWLGSYPAGSTMLHFEQHSAARVKWPVGKPQPKTLLDPRKGVLSPYVA
jgi:murein DD-endopeptidase MepM/ murein hydrolase activator NlpD